MLKVKKIFNLFGFGAYKSLDFGLSFFGLVLRKEERGLLYSRSGNALIKALLYHPKRVLDVGSGGGEHAKEFHLHGAAVDCIDFGVSVYAEKAKYKDINIIYGDFNNIEVDGQYDLVWASHILEHQRNVGLFIDKLIQCCKPNGTIVITVPYAHRRLLGGHLTNWSPGLLVYNCVLSGLDLNKSEIIHGRGEFSLIFQPVKIILPSSLSHDKGDIVKLKEYMPSFIKEGGCPYGI